MNGSLDALICGLMVHAGGQIDVLNHSLRHIRRRAVDRIAQMEDICNCKDSYICNRTIHVEKNNEELEKQLYEEIVECISHHQTIIK